MKDWPFTQNPILKATDGSYINALNVSIFHKEALALAGKKEPSILAMSNTYNPIHLAYQAKYDEWKSQGNSQQGTTLNVSQLLRMLSNKIQQWDVKIQNVYLQNTPEYRQLLPKHRKPFQEGSQTDRINAVNSLSMNIGDDNALAAVKTDVDAFYLQLDAARNVKVGSKSATKTFSKELEAARMAMCTAQFANLGSLIQKYPSSPESINIFFDLQNIRDGQQLVYRGDLNPKEAYTILKHTFGVSDEILLKNTGNTQIKFYLASSKDMEAGTLFIEMGKGEQTVLASALGSLTNPYLKVLNMDANFAGSFSVELV